MAKQGIELDSLTPLLAEVAGTTGWALCVGAGTSRGIFPQWRDLVRSLVQVDVPGEVGEQLASRLLSQFAPDSLIEAARDRLGLDEAAFSGRLVGLLYSDLKAMVTSAEWATIAAAFDAKSPGLLQPDQWREFHALRNRLFARTTASALAESLVPVVGSELQPAAILSFNAEPLFYALLNDGMVAATVPAQQVRAARGQLVQYFDLVMDLVSSRKPGRIPYFFCHGRLPVPDGGRDVPLQSLNKLVFSEPQYLQLAQTAYSWQSSAFLETCSSRRVLFVGVSLSDPNMRRWLAWVHDAKCNEIADRRGAAPDASTQHIWIRPRPQTTEEARWIESSVGHLGVRMVWLDDWTDVPAAMSVMLGSA